jgi:hypothetical protein
VEDGRVELGEEEELEPAERASRMVEVAELRACGMGSEREGIVRGGVVKVRAFGGNWESC